MGSGFILGIGKRLFDISIPDADREPAPFSVSAIHDRAEAAGHGVVRLAPMDRGSLVAGCIDWASADAMLAAPAFWSGLRADDAHRLAGIAAKTARELANGEPASETLAGAYALEFIVVALRAARSRAARSRAARAQDTHGRTDPWSPPNSVWTVDDAIRHIEANYADAFSLDWFVGKCAMNVTDFSRRFKDRAGCPLFEYINRQRIKRACSLLKSSSLSIIDIAEAVGYNNLSFFNRYFLRIVGVSPRAWRSGSGAISAR